MFAAASPPTRGLQGIERDRGGIRVLALRQLQRGHLPEVLADAGDDGVARVPLALARRVLGLPFRRGQDAGGLAGE
ncbi:hypothetical protein, partial [Thermomonas flagellata]|uniref:hypothetical protein n=1 Tax=Thermomonas flagellata TaxID=2888524 RepID=UPI001F0456E7